MRLVNAAARDERVIRGAGRTSESVVEHDDGDLDATWTLTSMATAT